MMMNSNLLLKFAVVVVVLTYCIPGITSRTTGNHNVIAAIPSRRTGGSLQHSRNIEQQQAMLSASQQQPPPQQLPRLFGIPRGGASKQKKKGRTASLSSSRQQKTVTGKKKVGAAAAAAAAEKGKGSAISDTMLKYKKILPLTRVYITLVGMATLLGLVLGEELTQSLLALDPIRTMYGFELWRPLTAATFLGPPSISWLMSGYYLFQYGSSLERAYGSAQHLIFLLSQIVLLSLFSAFTGQPFFAQSMITGMLHVLSRAMPHQKVKWLIFTVPYWSLPYGLMASDVLQSQSPMAALPHVLGILSGHFYQFHKFVWPKMGGEDWLIAPDVIAKRLDPNSIQNQDDTDSTEKDSINKALKARKRKKGGGRKLGS